MVALEGPVLRQAVNEHFDGVTLAKGEVYCRQRRVTECEVLNEPPSDWYIEARVQGSEPEAYFVDIDLSAKKGRIAIEADCSCPVEFNCKHAAAVLLHVAQQPGEWFQRLAREAELGTSAQSVSSPFNPGSLDPDIELDFDVWIRRVSPAPDEPGAGPERSTEPAERLLYILQPHSWGLRLELAIARRLKSGQFGQPRNGNFENVVSGQSAACVRPEDVKLARKIKVAQENFRSYEILIQGEDGPQLLNDLLAAGRCYWRAAGKDRQPLKLGAPRTATPHWKVEPDGKQRAGFQLEGPPAILLPIEPPWYLDEQANECGPLETGMTPQAASAWLSAPALPPSHASRVAEKLSRRNHSVAVPLPREITFEDAPHTQPTPCLRFYSDRLRYRYGNTWGTPGHEEEVNFARLEFDYAGARVPFDPARQRLQHYADGKIRRIQRDLKTEKRALRQIANAGLQPVEEILFQMDFELHRGAFVFVDEDDWMDFVLDAAPQLRQQGWKLDFDPSFRYQLAQPENWYSDAIPENGNDWFGVELGVTVDGQKINLLPVLLELLRNSPDLLNVEQLAKVSDNAVIPVPLPDGRKVLFPASRARQMLGALLELLNPDALNDRGQLRLPKLRAAELAGDAEWRWLGASDLRQLSERLRNFSGIQPVTPPENLRASLRPYQQDGLNWLQFLREYELAGILADDMGLGKTVQTLAHLLIEKQSGRMDRPSLVIAPTSLMTNWRQESERFAPDLRVLVLHGTERKQHFERIPEHDLIVTSYPLLPRDQEFLLAQEFHVVILDEAQFIKNPKTQYARIACALKARHHLCLTGTPMENHLGELWSLFHFLLPGFLGDEIRFNSLFRRPIERGNNEDRRKVLARRVAPFILRRKKAEVIRELPPKTEIVQNVELSDAQRDLYESVRLAMHQRVKQEVESKGLSRAHIVILDALLKLRQICCHPQLLSLPSAKNVTESAKLELLLDLVPEMIEEGRRILLFSQFTSMLAIIEKHLRAAKLPYVLLTGDTRDRATPVNLFQSGKVPLFLISLKAGGTGLNLTAADTVIHYDPWWNPAVENQATDRAHRIGQDKNVFVYKLMTVGTVEEKIGAMQARKRELVEGLLDENRPEQLKLSADDLDVLFAPIT